MGMKTLRSLLCRLWNSRTLSKEISSLVQESSRNSSDWVVELLIRYRILVGQKMFKDFIQSIYEKFILSILINVLKYLVWLMRSWKILGNGMSLPVKNGFAIRTMSWKNLKISFKFYQSLKNRIISPLIQILCRFNNHKESRKLFVKSSSKMRHIKIFIFLIWRILYFINPQSYGLERIILFVLKVVQNVSLLSLESETMVSISEILWRYRNQIYWTTMVS